MYFCRIYFINMKKTTFFITLLSALFFTNCARVLTESSVNHPDYNMTEQKKTIDNTPIQDAASAEVPVLEKFFTANTPYRWVSYRALMDFSLKNSRYSFQIFYVNRIDSIIYVNIHISGIELARLVATPQEVIFVNKMTKEYYKGDYKFLSTMLDFPVNFYMVQSLFNGIDFKDFGSNFVRLSQETDLQWVANRRCHVTDDICFHQFLTFNNSLQLQKNHLEMEQPKRIFIMEYRNYTEGEFLFFNGFSVDIPHISLKGTGELRNLKFNTPTTTNIKIPDSFTPIKP